MVAHCPSIMWFLPPLTDFFGPIGAWDQTQVIKRSQMALFLMLWALKWGLDKFFEVHYFENLFSGPFE